MIQLLMTVAEINKYCKQYFDTLENDNRCSLFPDVTVSEVHVFFTVIIKMRHNEQDTLKAYWSTLEQLGTFYSNMICLFLIEIYTFF
jgi:hypothetical protein